MTFSVERQHVVVAGAGRSGTAAAELLIARGAHVTLVDTAPAIEATTALAAAGVAIESGPHRPELFASADLVVLSPGVPVDQPAIAAARDAGVPVIGEIELASRWLSGRIVAVTGTKGKSTTTTLAARMFEEAGFRVTAGGNLGTALSRQVAASRPDALHVVEASSFQLETTASFHPWIAVLVNLSTDHLDRHGSADAYARAKARIFANQTPNDWAVVNADDPAALAVANRGRARRFDFSLEASLSDGVTVEGEQIVRRDGGSGAPLLPVASVSLPGRHLLSDVLAAAAVGCVAGVPPAAVERAVERFGGLEHTLEQVAEVAGVVFVNDSKATNVEAASRSLESVGENVVAIMGGRSKGGGFEGLRESVAAHARAVVTIGEAGAEIARALDGVAPVHGAGSMAEAVDRAFGLAKPGGVVVLAPACASFDQFSDYAARGRAFKTEVRRLAGQAQGEPGGRVPGGVEGIDR
jgi:UDP-N-acetylmuramoylalanine--D-glutamate ligase